jgi:hypothetical protein
MSGLNHGASKLSERLNLYLSRLVPFGFSGALLVAEGDAIIVNEGYGFADRKLDVPNAHDTVFSLSSITKQFTATAILKLEARGKLQTKDPIVKYFSKVPDDKAEVTLHHLLTHTAGLINYVGDDYEMFTRDEALEMVLNAPLQFTLGSVMSTQMRATRFSRLSWRSSRARLMRGFCALTSSSLPVWRSRATGCLVGRIER